MILSLSRYEDNTMKKLKLCVSGITDVGAIKNVNQDSFVYKVVDAGECFAGIFAVADGVGGLEKGEVASSMAISNINRWWENEFKNHYHDQEYLIRTLIDCFKNTNTEIINMAKRNEIKAATTLTVLFIYKNNYFIVHIGDSRIYKINGLFNRKIDQITQDHSCIIDKQINGRTIKKSVLTECLGNKEQCNHFCAMSPIKKNDIFIVCSDGIYKTMADNKILDLINQNKNNIQNVCQSLVDTVKLNGETDNISVIAIKVND